MSAAANAERFGQGSSQRLWLGGGLAVSTVANLAVLAVAALLVDGTSFGRFVVWQTLVALAAVFGRLGLARAALAVVGEAEEAGPAIRSVVVVSLAASLIVSIIAATIAGLVTNSIGATTAAAVTFMWTFGEAARLPAAETFRARGRLAPATVLGDAGRVSVAFVLVTVGGYVWESTTGLALGAALASGLAAVAAIGAAWRQASTAGGGDPSRIEIETRPPRPEVEIETRPPRPEVEIETRPHGETARRGLSMIGLELQGVIQRHATTWLAASFLSLSDAGVFTLAARAAFFVGLIVQAEVQYVGPAVVASADDPDPSKLSDRLAFLTIRAAGAAVITGLAIMVVAPFAIDYVADATADGLTIAVVILVIGQIINVATGPGGQVLTLRGHPFLVQAIGFGAVMVLVVGGAIGASTAGFVGLALASAVSTAGRNIVVAEMCRRRLRIDPRARLT